MATDRLAVYNIACLALQERKLDAITDDAEVRYLLDEVWDRGKGAVSYCLEQGLWNFAKRAVQIDKDSSVTPSFGFNNAFSIPTDYIRLDQLSASEYFSQPLMLYELEGAYIYCDVDPIYMRYVSDDTSWGNDMSLWPDTFTMWVGYYLASQVGPSLLNDAQFEKLEARVKKVLNDARSKDASAEPVRFPPLSSWASSRSGRYSGRRDRGRRSALIG